MSWGGFPNGQIPSDRLSPIPATLGPLLRSDAAASVKLLQAAFFVRFGFALLIVEGYRDFLRQTYLYAGWIAHKFGFNLAAKPGKSVHGWALACDFGSGVNVYGSAQKQWMDANAPLFGWYPTGNGFSPREAWHFEFRGGAILTTIDQVAAYYNTAAGGQLTEETDEMSAEDVKAIVDRLDNITKIVADDPGNGLRALVRGLGDSQGNITKILATDTVNGVPGGIRAMVVQAVAEARAAHATVSNVENIVAVDTVDGVKGGIRGRLAAIAKTLTGAGTSGAAITTATDAQLVAELTRRMKG